MLTFASPFVRGATSGRIPKRAAGISSLGVNENERAKKMRKIIFSVVVFFVLPSLTFAEADDVFKRLVNTKSLKCQFGKGSVASWKHGPVKLNNDDFNATIYFDSIDFDKGTARKIANQGSTDVAVIPGVMFITFIEQTGLGNMIFTSVFFHYVKGTEDFISVTSRHVNLFDGPLPSQYHGTCKVWE
jgi:hypothetical protein